MEEELPEYKLSPIIGSITPLVWIKYNDEFYVARSPFFKVFSDNDSATIQYTKQYNICEYVKDRELDREYVRLYPVLKDTYKYSRMSGSNSFINVENALIILEFLKTTDRCLNTVTEADIDRYTNWLQSDDHEDEQPQKFDVKNLFNHRLRLQKRLEYVRTDRFKQFSDRIFAEYMEDGRKRNREYLENHMDDILDDNDYKEEIRRDPKTRRIAVAMVASRIVPDYRKGYKVRLPIKKYKNI